MDTAMVKVPLASRRKVIWGNLLFFIATTLLGVVGGSFYIARFGLSLPEILLFLFYYFATSFSITVGYHRLFSHVSFKAKPIVRFLALFFGAASFEQSALTWSSQHRRHHRYVDTDFDPYSIKKGFFYAHLGWMIFWEHPENFDNAQDLKKDPMLMHQHNHYPLWALTSGILLPVLIGALTGHALGAFLIAFCARVTLVYHITWCINSFAHTVGKATYDIDSTAKDHWLTALLTNGEGYHNFHHRFPGDYRNGARWFDWDPTKWLIRFLEWAGLASNLIRVSQFRIYLARIHAEKKRAQRAVAGAGFEAQRKEMERMIAEQFERVKQTLHDWEVSAQAYRDVIQGKIERHSEAGRLAVMKYFQTQKIFRVHFARCKAWNPAKFAGLR